MIPALFTWLDGFLDLSSTPWRVLQYTSVRCVGAFVMSFAVIYFAAPSTIARLYRAGLRDEVRTHDDFFNSTKSGTPTMGGVLIILGTFVAALTFGAITQGGRDGGTIRTAIPLLLLTMLWFGTIGGIDDYLKKKRGGSDAGMSRGAKFFLQVLFASFFAAVVLNDATSPLPAEVRTRLYLPFPSPRIIAPWDLGPFYGAFIVVALVAIANAINFADGLDGLAVLPSGLAAIVFGIFAYIMNHHFAAHFFDFPYVPGMREIAVFASAVAGSCVGFLWFNAYPAQVFMGDTGSMALGGVLGGLAVLAKQELLFLIVGAVFVFEAVSVLVQDYIGIRLIGRRFWFRAPAHHSFQHRGVAETKVVIRFWIVSLVFAVLSLATLKLR